MKKINEKDSISMVFFEFLKQIPFDVKDLNLSNLENHKASLEKLSGLGNSGVSLFDISKRTIVFYSSNYGKLLGYKTSDYNKLGQQFFSDKIHPEDKIHLSNIGVCIFKLFYGMKKEQVLNYKAVNEYRILNSENKYVRLIEQHQIIELDKKSKPWLMMSIVDISPNQDNYEGIKSQLLNFKTGQILPLNTQFKPQVELTKREIEILNLVKEGYLSKEIADKLSISLHTVNTHRQKFLSKLRANNSIEAIAFGKKYGLLN